MFGLARSVCMNARRIVVVLLLCNKVFRNHKNKLIGYQQGSDFREFPFFFMLDTIHAILIMNFFFALISCGYFLR